MNQRQVEFDNLVAECGEAVRNQSFGGDCPTYGWSEVVRQYLVRAYELGGGHYQGGATIPPGPFGVSNSFPMCQTPPAE